VRKHFRDNDLRLKQQWNQSAEGIHPADRAITAVGHCGDSQADLDRAEAPEAEAPEAEVDDMKGFECTYWCCP
jgi:hypothetical protein